MERFAELREAVDSIEIVDAHAHNIAALDSSVPFLSCFSEATTADALSQVPHTLNFKVPTTSIFPHFFNNHLFTLKIAIVVCFDVNLLSLHT